MTEEDPNPRSLAFGIVMFSAMLGAVLAVSTWFKHKDEKGKSR